VKRLVEFGLLAWAAASVAAHPVRHQNHRGPVTLVIDLSAQRAVLYRNGAPIAASRVSTGSRGRETPTGTFTVLQKRITHRSRTYDDAPMPYMQRLSWKGLAMHAGYVPGYPASHGCIRLPRRFAKRLYAVTKVGTRVVIRRRIAPVRVYVSPRVAFAAPRRRAGKG
jgi:lipoprotein-anchoring transpeptidase ErfK/SrfK